MIYSYESFTMSNVVSKRYFTDKAHIIDAEKDFLNSLVSIQKIRLRGPLVYVIEYVAESEILSIRFMISIYNDYNPELKDFRYDSYFGIETALCCKIYPNEMKSQADQLYDLMCEEAKKENMKLISSIYFTKSMLDNNGFFSLYAAVEPEVQSYVYV